MCGGSLHVTIDDLAMSEYSFKDGVWPTGVASDVEIGGSEGSEKKSSWRGPLTRGGRVPAPSFGVK